MQPGTAVAPERVSDERLAGGAARSRRRDAGRRLRKLRPRAPGRCCVSDERRDVCVHASHGACANRKFDRGGRRAEVLELQHSSALRSAEDARAAAIERRAGGGIPVEQAQHDRLQLFSRRQAPE